MPIILSEPLYSGVNYQIVCWKTSIEYDAVVSISINKTEPNAI